MTPADSVHVFETNYLPAVGKDASAITALLQSFWAFFRNERPSGLAEIESDMLLFQSGIYDWGSGPFFEVDLVRQFIELAGDDDDELYSHFHLTCYYAADARLAALGRESRWCTEISEIDDFASWVEGNAVVSALDSMPRVKTVISWGPI